MIIRKSNLNLVLTSEPILHTSPDPFDFNSDIDPVMLSNVLLEKMKDLGGIGLSANQVGLNMRLFVLGAGDVQMSVFNPEVLETSQEEISLDEGCLSYPGIYMKVTRPQTCKVRYQNNKGEIVVQDLTGLTARIFLHEYDHMLGITFKSKVSTLKWDMATKRKNNRNKKIATKLTQQLFRNIKKDVASNGNHSK